MDSEVKRGMESIKSGRRPATQEQAPILIFWYFLNFL